MLIRLNFWWLPVCARLGWEHGRQEKCSILPPPSHTRTSSVGDEPHPVRRWPPPPSKPIVLLLTPFLLHPLFALRWTMLGSGQQAITPCLGLLYNMSCWPIWGVLWADLQTPVHNALEPSLGFDTSSSLIFMGAEEPGYIFFSKNSLIYYNHVYGSPSNDYKHTGLSTSCVVVRLGACSRVGLLQVRSRTGRKMG